MRIAFASGNLQGKRTGCYLIRRDTKIPYRVQGDTAQRYYIMMGVYTKVHHADITVLLGNVVEMCPGVGRGEVWR